MEDSLMASSRTSQRREVMRALGVLLALLCLLLLGGVEPASAQDVLGPFCVQVGAPVNATFKLLAPVVTASQFQVVGSVFGDVPVNGAGLLNDLGQSRFLITAGATSGGGGVGAPISITGTMDLGTLTGSGFCYGGGNCGGGAAVLLQVLPSC
jgi:hypothetical protein